MSEKSTRKALDYAVKSTAARNRPVFRPEFQLCPCHTAEEPYNSSESGLKKEIPVFITCLRLGHGPPAPPIAARSKYPATDKPFSLLQIQLSWEWHWCTSWLPYLSSKYLSKVLRQSHERTGESRDPSNRTHDRTEKRSAAIGPFVERRVRTGSRRVRARCRLPRAGDRYGRGRHRGGHCPLNQCSGQRLHLRRQRRHLAVPQ